jgi:Ca-activated chloride channel family protein
MSWHAGTNSLIQEENMKRKRFTQALIPKRLHDGLWILMAAVLVLAACNPAKVVQSTKVPAMTDTANLPAIPQAGSVVETVVEAAAEMEVQVTRVFEAESAMQTATHLGRQAPTDMFFEEYGTNPFVDTEDDHLSTFAIDVDTGAYSVMRRYINDGNLPPDEAVRVEEFINYFEQDYDRPESGAFAIHLEGAPAPYGESDRYHLVRVGLQGYQVDPEERPDAMLIFVVDVSGSMDMENRLGLVKEALQVLLDGLRPTDRVGLVVYGSTGRVILEPAPVEYQTRIEDAIHRLRPEGSTNAAEGIMLAYRLADDYAREGEINRLILCSDGVANVGQTTADAILQHAAEGIALSTFGFGMGNYNDVLMEQLADKGDGSYAYIDTLDEAERVFRDQLLTTLLTIAKDTKIQVEFNTEVVIRYRLLGYENRDVADEDFRNDDVDAGEIGAGHSVTALYEVKLAEDADPAATAMTVMVRYADPDTDEVTEISRSISPADFASDFFEASYRFQLDAVVAEFAEILRDSYWAKESSLLKVAVDARRIAEYLTGDEDVQEFAQLASQAALMTDQ